MRAFACALFAALTVLGLASPAAAAPAALSWAPAAGYSSFPTKAVTSSGFTSVSGNGGDVRIVLPKDKPVGPIKISSCRNVSLIGGAIRVLPTETVDGSDQRAVYIKGCTGTVHIEGLSIDGNVSGSTADAIAISAPSATVQIENVRAVGMKGSANNHADCVQPWGGVKALLIDRFTCSTNYQGLHVGIDLGPIGSATIRNTNISSSGTQSDGKGGYMIWLPRTTDKHYPISLENVYVSGRPGASVNRTMMPNSSESTCPLHVSGNVVTWQTSKCSWIKGSVIFGNPAADFAPAGTPGLSYATPGYL